VSKAVFLYRTVTEFITNFASSSFPLGHLPQGTVNLQDSNLASKYIADMSLAIEEARAGLREGGIPVGSILFRNGTILGRGHNMRIQRNDPTAHAEIECLRNAGRIGNYTDTILFSTLMPCHLCAGAIIQFKIGTVVGEDLNFGGTGELLESHGVKVIDVDSKECVQLMADFIRDNPKLWNEDIGTL